MYVVSQIWLFSALKIVAVHLEGKQLDKSANESLLKYRVQLQQTNSNYSSVNYKDAKETCKYFKNKPLFCNEHNLERRCQCFYLIDDINKISGTPNCDIMPASFPNIPNNITHDYILSIGIGFPIPEEFWQHSDEMFVEDIEIFTLIPRSSVVVLRKGCDLERAIFEYQFGIIQTANKSSAIDVRTRPRLRTLSPEIFLRNNNFMEKNGLNIEYVKYALSLRPIVEAISAEEAKVSQHYFLLLIFVSIFILIVLVVLGQHLVSVCKRYQKVVVDQIQEDCEMEEK